ncbi:Putative G-protein coupled receptor 160, partial [Heterocephalus glaber]
MTSFSSDSCSFQSQLHQTNQPLDATFLLFLIVLGKILLNILTLGMRRKNSYQNFMKCFCVSLAFLDFLFLVNISIISYFRDFILLGIRFTKYHILILIWILVLACFREPGIYQSLKAQNISYQCPVYVSIQSYCLSLSMMIILFMAFITSWSEVITLVQAIRITSYLNECILYFPSSSLPSYIVNSKRILLPKLIVFFLGTWLLFVLLQVFILLLKVQIPAYIGSNIPWLYFVNNFLIATICWFNCHKLYLRNTSLPRDSFVNWKCCFIPLTMHNFGQIEKPISIII